MRIKSSRKWIPLFTLAALLAAAQAPAATFQIDPVHSSVVFRVKHFGTSYVYGRFNQVSGTLSYDPAALGSSTISVEIDAGSVDTRVDRRDQHIKSADFLNVAQFPKITFKSTKVEGSGDQLEVTGDITFLGVTKPITVTVQKTGTGKNPQSGKDLIGFETELTINRSDFGNKYLIGPVSDEVKLIFAIEADSM